jgi:hypothetical protein
MGYETDEGRGNADANDDDDDNMYGAFSGIYAYAFV